MKTPYLVAYDYGMGAVWAIVNAESAEQIEADFPELKVIEDRPSWITDAELERIKRVHTYDISDRTFGLLADLIHGRRDRPR